MMLSLTCIYPALIVFGFLIEAQANQVCRGCIPLQDLLIEGYGIELTADGLSSAIAFHNGSVVHMAERTGSAQYQSLMSSMIQMNVDKPPQRRSIRCFKERGSSSPSPFDKSFLSFIGALLSLPKQIWDAYVQHSVLDKLPVLPSPDVEIFKAELEALLPFADMSSDQRAKIPVSISLPAWLAGSEEACKATEAAGVAFGRVYTAESPPSASFTALGYELCRISYEYFDCTGPGRIMTIELRHTLTVLSVAQTPLSIWYPDTVTFSVSRENDRDVLLDWVKSFVDAERPDIAVIIVAGDDKDSSDWRRSLLKSRSVAHQVKRASVVDRRIVAEGVARATKDRLESHTQDCLEGEECLEIRREADRIAGRYRVGRQDVWPAIGRPHDEL